MNREPILIIDDDLDGSGIPAGSLERSELYKPVNFFSNPQEVINFLKQEKTIPFLIISNVNFGKMDGFEFKKKLLEDTYLNNKSIPFVFFRILHKRHKSRSRMS